MRALRVHRYGEPTEALTLDHDALSPVPGEGQLRVRVEGAACNLPDVLLCRGRYQLRPELPFTLGLDVAGRVDAIGPGLDPDWVGRRVVGVAQPPHGAYAEQALLAAAGAYPLPDGADAGHAAAMHIAFVTGHVALHRRAALQAGEVLLVLAAAGGVGTAAVQLGLLAGATVVAAAGSEQRRQVALALGAHAAVSDDPATLAEEVAAATGGRGADVVYDPVGGELFQAARRCTAAEGRLLVIGFAGGDVQQVPANALLYRNQSVLGVYVGGYAHDPAGQRYLRGVHDELMDCYVAGRIRPVVDREVDLAGVPAALADLAARRVVGRIVVRPDGTGG